MCEVGIMEGARWMRLRRVHYFTWYGEGAVEHLVWKGAKKLALTTERWQISCTARNNDEQSGT